jgi:hypothetical protein
MKPKAPIARRQLALLLERELQRPCPEAIRQSAINALAALLLEAFGATLSQTPGSQGERDEQ